MKQHEQEIKTTFEFIDEHCDKIQDVIKLEEDYQKEALQDIIQKGLKGF